MTENESLGSEPALQHEELADVSLYTLGVLAGAERDRVRVHIDQCAVCRDELVRLTGVRTLLGRLTTPDAPGPAEPASPRSEPPPGLREQVVDQVLQHRRQRTRRRRRFVGLAVAAALVVVAVVSTVVVGLTQRAAPAVPPVAGPYVPMQLTAGAGPAATASAAITAHPWGTEISVRATDFSAGTVIDLYVVPSEGDPEQVGSWQAAPGTVVCAATTWYPRSELRRIEARSGDGTVVASENVPT